MPETKCVVKRFLFEYQASILFCHFKTKTVVDLGFKFIKAIYWMDNVYSRNIDVQNFTHFWNRSSFAKTL